MKLASLRKGGRDGTLVVVDKALRRAVTVPDVARTLQQALDDWAEMRPLLFEVSERLETGTVDGAFAFDRAMLAAPLPRAYQWLDASAYVTHVELVRKAREAPFLRAGDRIRIEMLDRAGRSIFGAIDQEVVT